MRVNQISLSQHSNNQLNVCESLLLNLNHLSFLILDPPMFALLIFMLLNLNHLSFQILDPPMFVLLIFMLLNLNHLSLILFFLFFALTWIDESCVNRWQ
jgi:hypothetical protein